VLTTSAQTVHLTSMHATTRLLVIEP